MTPPVPSNRVVAHDVLDVLDRVLPLRERLEHPDAVERELRVLAAHREELLRSVEEYEQQLHQLLSDLIPDEDEMFSILQERYVLPEGED